MSNNKSSKLSEKGFVTTVIDQNGKEIWVEGLVISKDGRKLTVEVIINHEQYAINNI